VDLSGIVTRSLWRFVGSVISPYDVAIERQKRGVRVPQSGTKSGTKARTGGQ